MTESEATAIGRRMERRVEDDPAVRRWHVAKRIVWMLALAEAFLIYYLLDKLQEALSILK